MRVLAIGITNLRRMLRDRSNIFFVFVLPLAIILLIGAQFGGDGPTMTIGVVSGDGPLTESVRNALEQAEGVAVESFGAGHDMIDAVERGSVAAGVEIPEDFDEEISAGRSPAVGFVVRPEGLGALRPIVDAAVAEATAPVRVARVVAKDFDVSPEQALALVEEVVPVGLDVRTETGGESLFPPGIGQFSVGATQQLVLFVFLTALTGSAALIQSRQLGVTRRMLSTPTTATTIVVGEAVGRFSVGVVQGLYIVGVTWIAFGVNWGDPLGVAALLAALAATGAGAAMLLGTVFHKDQQAGGFSILVGLGVAALGGSMLPIELFSPTMTRVAHFTPHAWAIGGLSELVYRDGTLGDVLAEVGVLSAFAIVLLGVSGWRLRKVITAGS